MTSPRRRSIRAASAHGAMVLGAIVLFLLIQQYGETLSAPARGAPAPAGPGVAHELALKGGPDVLWHLLLALTAVAVVGRLLGRLFRHVGQPPVIGEVVGGILLGPSLLGRIAPDAYLYVLPPRRRPGCVDEHAWTHGAHRAQHRPGAGRDIPDDFHDDGTDGAGDHGRHDTNSRESDSEISPRSW